MKLLKDRIIRGGGAMSGFSLMEIMVSVGIGAAVIYAATQIMDTSFDSKEYLKKEREADVRSLTYSNFSNRFINLMNRASISVNYFKLPVYYEATDDHCGNTANGCFMSLDTNGNVGVAINNGKDPFEVDISGGVNFYSDEDLFLNTSSIKGNLSNVHFKRIKYKKYIRKSKDKRYFVGWSLVEDGSTPFTMMSRIKNRFYFSVNQNEAMAIFSDSLEESQIKELRTKFFAKLHNFGDNEKFGDTAADHTGMFYLYYNVMYPGAWSMVYIDGPGGGEDVDDGGSSESSSGSKIIKCRSGDGIDDACTAFYKLSRGMTAIADGSEEATETDKSIAEREDYLSGMYLLEISDPDEPAENGKIPMSFLPSIDIDATKFFWLNDQKPEHPYFPYKSASLVDASSIADDGNMANIAPAYGLSKAPASPSFLLNSFHVDAADPNVSSGSNMVVHLFPVLLHKFYLISSSSDKKRLVIKSNKSKNPTTLITGLLPDSRVVFARQLGTTRISAFIFNNDEEESETDTSDREPEDEPPE